MFFVPADSTFPVIKNVKSKNVTITEILSEERIMKLKEAKKQNIFKWGWMIDGDVLFKEDDGPTTKPKVSYK